MGLFIKKPLADLMTEANDSGSKSLKRILGPWSLIALGVGVIIGAGLFSITGAVAAGYTGPAITLSFAIAALGCCFAGLCYAEFASMIPVAGSAYTYSYATMGELVAWIIGWDLVLEYCVAATTVSISWSRYLVVFLEGFGVHLPQALTACPWDGGIVNIPAFVIVVLMSILLIRGTEGSSIFNGIIVFLKVSVVLVFVVLGWKYIRMENYTPYIPANTGTLGEFGFSGILRGAAIVFFAFLGFDAVSIGKFGRREVDADPGRRPLAGHPHGRNLRKSPQGPPYDDIFDDVPPGRRRRGDRHAGHQGVRTDRHRRGRAVALFSRDDARCARLPLLQLHPHPRAGLCGDRSREGGRNRLAALRKLPENPR